MTARHPQIGPYIRGRLVLAGLDLRTAISDWCDAVYAILAEAPGERLEKLLDHFTMMEAVIDPERARATWGLLPEHTARAGALEQETQQYIPPIPSGRSAR
jgi:hypothetical protein